MNKEKQIEEMARILCRFYTSEDDYCGKCPDCVVRDEAKQIYNAGYRKQEWISVDERLPETEGKYLVCTANGNIGVGNFIDYYGTGKRICFDTWAVTHWMPLPEPPKMKGGE